MRGRTPDRLIRDYMRRLGDASRGLPRGERRELRAQIEEHLRAALPADPSELEVREVLERLGDPEEIVAEQYGHMPLRRGIGAQAVAAVVLLLVGGFLAGVGWIVGVVLLWTSAVWTTREKLVGTLVIPGGLFASLIISTTQIAGGGDCFGGTLRSNGRLVKTFSSCTGGFSTSHEVLAVALLAAVVLAPIASAVFLVRRAQRGALA
jgi:hypothetical protein